jgi:hypothetical protein
MQITMKNLGAMTLALALPPGVCLFSSPAKADVAAAEATFKTKCAGFTSRWISNFGDSRIHWERKTLKV